MNRQTLKRLMVKGTMAYVAVFALALMVAMPAMALIANSVGTREIQDHSIRSRDLRNKAVTTDRIAPRAVKRGKIGKRAIRTEHVSYMSDSKIRYSTKTGYLSIPVSEFSPISNSYDYGKGNVLYMNSGSGSFYATVHLPQAAVIKKFKFATADNTDTAYVRARLRRITNSNPGVTSDLASIDTSGQANSAAWIQQSTSSIISPTVDNNTFSYVVTVYLGGPTTFLAAGPVVIEYTYSSPGS